MIDSNKIKPAKKLVDWEIMAIFIGIIITVPMLALLGSAVYAVFIDRPGAYMGILLTIIIMLIFWAIIWMGIGLFSGLNVKDVSVSKLDELERENERLQKLVTELSQGKKLQNDSK